MLSVPLLGLGIINYFYIHRYLINSVTASMHIDLEYKINVFESQFELYNALIFEFRSRKMFYSYFIRENPVGFMDINDILRENVLKIPVDDILFLNSLSNRIYSSDFAILLEEYMPGYDNYLQIDSSELMNIFLSDIPYSWVRSGNLRLDRTFFDLLLYIVPFERIQNEVVSSFIFWVNINTLRNFIFIPQDNTEYEIYLNDLPIFSSIETSINNTSLLNDRSFIRNNIFISIPGKYGLHYTATRPKSTIYSALDSLLLILPLSLISLLGLELIIIKILFKISKLNKQNIKLSEENIIFKTITNSIIKKDENTDIQNKHLIELIDDYILNNYGGLNFSTKLMADVFKMSVSNLSHFYKKYRGVTISDTVTLLRMETACNYLKNSEMTIQEIVRKVGYQEVSGFIKKFKIKYGLTPGEYRLKSCNLNNSPDPPP